VDGVSVAHECKDDVGYKAFGLWVYFRASAWSWVRQFTSDCMGAVIAEVVNGRVIAIANVRGIFDRRGLWWTRSFLTFARGLATRYER